ncbi:hypothetical protein [uncultured Lactobacillus sp.]|uniref:hypothetical protein n=1 Tax=uncultured Lactobacillus sp. TaxID=153152 RepID=UPI00259BE714|nr:hypothetical protein [uncultured Lactobacillus sp.]
MTNFDKNDVNANQAKNEEESEEKKMAKETNDQREESKMNEENKFPKLTKEEVKQMLQLPDIANDDGLYVPSDGDKVATIYKTTNYDQFIYNTEYLNDRRINFLIYKYLTRQEPLPMIAVRPNSGYWEVVDEQDSLYAAVQLGIPVYFYKAYDSAPQAPRQIDMSFDDMKAIVDFCLDNHDFRY